MGNLVRQDDEAGPAEANQLFVILQDTRLSVDLVSFALNHVREIPSLRVGEDREWGR